MYTFIKTFSYLTLNIKISVYCSTLNFQESQHEYNPVVSVGICPLLIICVTLSYRGVIWFGLISHLLSLKDKIPGYQWEYLLRFNSIAVNEMYGVWCLFFPPFIWPTWLQQQFFWKGQICRWGFEHHLRAFSFNTINWGLLLHPPVATRAV